MSNFLFFSFPQLPANWQDWTIEEFIGFDIKAKPGWVVDKIEVYGGNKDRIYKKAREFKLYKSDAWVIINFRAKDHSKYSFVYIDLK